MKIAWRTDNEIKNIIQEAELFYSESSAFIFYHIHIDVCPKVCQPWGTISMVVEPGQGGLRL